MHKKKKKQPIIVWISRVTEKAFDNTQHLFMIKSLNKLGMKENFLNPILVSYEKHRTTRIPNGERYLMGETPP